MCIAPSSVWRRWGGGGAKLRDIEEGGETLGVILISRKSRRQGSNVYLSGSLLVFGDGLPPVVFARIRANKKAKVFAMISNVHVFPLRNVNLEPISHSQSVSFGACNGG